MRPEVERTADVRAWLRKASQDLLAGQYLLDASPPFTGDACFHAQQAAEKALKGWLTWNDAPFRKTHDLVEIGRACVALPPDWEGLPRASARLPVFDWASG